MVADAQDKAVMGRSQLVAWELLCAVKIEATADHVHFACNGWHKMPPFRFLKTVSFATVSFATNYSTAKPRCQVFFAVWT
jgi:hypothetical protein